MGVCSSTALPDPNPEAIDLTHFDVQRVIGEGGFGKVNAVIKVSDVGSDKDTWCKLMDTHTPACCVHIRTPPHHTMLANRVREHGVVSSCLPVRPAGLVRLSILVSGVPACVR